MNKRRLMQKKENIINDKLNNIKTNYGYILNALIEIIEKEINVIKEIPKNKNKLKHSIKENIINDKLNNIKTNYGYILNALIEIIEKEINVIKEIPKNKNHFFAKIENKDDETKFKSLKRIAEKIAGSNGELTAENFVNKMNDLFRLRIICNYLSDVKIIAEHLKNSKSLENNFEIYGPDDRIYEIRMKEPEKAKGVRAYYMRFKSKIEPETPQIELQIMTLLSLAWDKKDHYLVYERERTGQKVSPKEKIKMNAMSELLYVADEFFDLLRHTIVGNKK